MAQEATQRLEAITYMPIHAEVALARALANDAMGAGGGQHGEEADFREALRIALEWRQDDVAHHAATSLIELVGQRLGEPAEGLRYREVAEALVHGDALREARTRAAIGAVLLAREEHEEALAELEAAAALVDGTDPLIDLRLRSSVAQVLIRLSRPEEAETRLRELLVTYEPILAKIIPR